MASSERVVGAAENVDKRGPSEPEPYEVDVDERRVLYCTCITCKETETLLLEVGDDSPWGSRRDEREPRGRVLEGSMTLSNDEFAALGLGLGVGTGATLMSPAFGIGMGVAGMVAILYATQQKRNGEPEDDDCVELTVTTGNSHPRTPDFGAEMVSTVETLTSGNRWTLQADASSGRPVGDTEAADD